MKRLLVGIVSVAFLFLFVGCGGDDCPTCSKFGPVLTLNVHKIDFGASGTTATFTISNKGEKKLSWTLEVNYHAPLNKVLTPAQSWLNLSATSGSDNATITCTANRSELEGIGVSRATIIVNAPGAENTTEDSVEVFINTPNAWLSGDDGTYEDCATVGADDWYWVKGFVKPEGARAVIVDSIRFDFCPNTDLIQLLAASWTIDQETEQIYPGAFAFISPFQDTCVNGRNTYPVNWFFEDSLFYVGYFQPGLTAPRLSFDTSPEDTQFTDCWVAIDTDTSEGVYLEWDPRGLSETFAIRVFVTPVLDYNPKLAVKQSSMEIESNLRAGFARRGAAPSSITPRK